MRRLALLCTLSACQGYDFVYQPDTHREGTHLRFVVEQPSKADVLFVVDNSVSMTEEQCALKSSIDGLLDELAPLDTSYRIGVTSTDMKGFVEGCFGVPFSAQVVSDADGGASKGNCVRPEVELKRPNDGARGRLIAAYDPNEFDLDFVCDPGTDPCCDPSQALGAVLISSAERDAFEALAPLSATTGPIGVNGSQGARPVIDRELVQHEACIACGCVLTDATPDDVKEQCAEGDSCYDDCAESVATALVKAYFRSNVNGLGVRGQGYEAGLHAAMQAVGIDPTDPIDLSAVNPLGNNPTLPGEPNEYTGMDDLGQLVTGSWVRPEALLAVMVVSDEEDCSMPDYLYESVNLYEEGQLLPVGSICYQPDAQALFFDTTRMSRLMKLKKDPPESPEDVDPPTDGRTAVGFIGGARQAGPVTNLGRDADAADCQTDVTGEPSNVCTCLEMEPDYDLRWCDFTQDASGDFATLGACDAMAGSRYVQFVDRFRRRTYDSICQADYSDTLAEFARIATVACFDLAEDLFPARNDPENIMVLRAPREEAEAGAEPTLLPNVDPDASGVLGWYYVEDDPRQICLVGVDRLLGDVYDIFILTRDEIDFTR